MERSSPRIRVEELGLNEALRECTDEWGRFCERAEPTPFLHPQYLAAWARGLGTETACRFVVARREGELAGVGPFMLASDPFGPLSVPSLKFIGNNVGNPGDILYGEIAAAPPRTAVVRSILERLSEWRAPKWDLGYLPAASETRTIAPELLGPPRNGALPERVPYVGLPLPRDWDEFLRDLSGNARRNFRRRLARLRELGDVNLRFEREPDAVRRTVRELVLNHRRWWEGTDRAAWFGDERVERFLEESSALLAAQGRFLAFRLEVAGQPIAWNVGAFDRGRYFEQFISFDREYTAYSPGVLLAILMARHLIDSGATKIELGPGINDRKRDLGGKPIVYDRLRGYRGWFRAIAALHASWEGRAA